MGVRSETRIVQRQSREVRGAVIQGLWVKLERPVRRNRTPRAREKANRAALRGRVMHENT